MTNNPVSGLCPVWGFESEMTQPPLTSLAPPANDKPKGQRSCSQLRSLPPAVSFPIATSVEALGLNKVLRSWCCRFLGVVGFMVSKLPARLLSSATKLDGTPLLSLSMCRCLYTYLCVNISFLCLSLFSFSRSAVSLPSRACTVQNLKQAYLH